MNAADFKDLQRLEIKLGEDYMYEIETGDYYIPVWIATWFVYDDAKCDHGHLHKQYKTKKNTDLIKLIEEIRDDTAS